jgi:ParB family chromosome partitioning protein
MLKLTDRSRLDKLPYEEVVELETKRLTPNPYQPRIKFDEETIKELAESIKEYGQLQPAVVCKRNDGKEGYIIVAGERRWRACKIVKLPLKCVARKAMNVRELQLAAMQENIMRDNLHPVEAAIAMQRLVETKAVESWADFNAMVGLSGKSAMRYKALAHLSQSTMKLAIESDYRDSLVLETLNRQIAGAGQAPVLQKIVDDKLERNEAIAYIKATADAAKEPKAVESLEAKFNARGAPAIVWSWRPKLAFKDSPTRQEALRHRLNALLQEVERAIIREFGGAD